MKISLDEVKITTTKKKQLKKQKSKMTLLSAYLLKFFTSLLAELIFDFIFLSFSFMFFNIFFKQFKDSICVEGFSRSLIVTSLYKVPLCLLRIYNLFFNFPMMPQSKDFTDSIERIKSENSIF